MWLKDGILKADLSFDIIQMVLHSISDEMCDLRCKLFLIRSTATSLFRERNQIGEAAQSCLVLDLVCSLKITPNIKV